MFGHTIQLAQQRQLGSSSKAFNKYIFLLFLLIATFYQLLRTEASEGIFFYYFVTKQINKQWDSRNKCHHHNKEAGRENSGLISKNRTGSQRTSKWQYTSSWVSQATLFYV